MCGSFIKNGLKLIDPIGTLTHAKLVEPQVAKLTDKYLGMQFRSPMSELWGGSKFAIDYEGQKQEKRDSAASNRAAQAAQGTVVNGLVIGQKYGT